MTRRSFHYFVDMQKEAALKPTIVYLKSPRWRFGTSIIRNCLDNDPHADEVPGRAQLHYPREGPGGGQQETSSHSFKLISETRQDPQSWAKTLLLVNSILVKLFSFLVIAVQGGGVTICKFDRLVPLFLPYLAIPTRTRNEGVRTWFFGPRLFEEQITSIDV